MSSYYEKILATGEVKCIDEEIPFEIPQGWEWCRVSSLFQINPKVVAEDNTSAAFIPMEAISAGYGSEFRYYEKKWGEIKSGYTAFADNDIAFAKITPCFQNRKSVIFEGLPNGIGAGTTELKILRTYGETINRWFVLYFLESPYFIDEATFKGTANQQRIIVGYLENKLFPLPPLAEQGRIVGKIGLVMPIIDKYSKSQELLDKMNVELNECLKKSVLQEAIQGKLVPQIAEEGTAQELLEQIKAEKQKLVKEGKLKKSALASSVIYRGDDNRYYEKIGKKIVCIEDEVPFEIPNSWVWARLGTIVDFSKSQTISSSMLDMDSWILDLEDIEKDSGRLLQKKRMQDLLSKSDKHLFYKGNVLYSKLRPYLNKVIVADEDGACTTEILAFDFGHIYNKYAQAYLMSPFFVDYANSDSYGIKMPRLGSKKGNNALFPIPPLREQQRIVEKIEQLMQLLK